MCRRLTQPQSEVVKVSIPGSERPRLYPATTTLSRKQGSSPARISPDSSWQNTTYSIRPRRAAKRTRYNEVKSRLPRASRQCRITPCLGCCFLTDQRWPNTTGPAGLIDKHRSKAIRLAIMDLGDQFLQQHQWNRLTSRWLNLQFIGLKLWWYVQCVWSPIL